MNKTDQAVAMLCETLALMRYDGALELRDHANRIEEAVNLLKQSKRRVGCEGTDGVLRVHFESETCDVCKDLQDNT